MEKMIPNDSDLEFVEGFMDLVEFQCNSNLGSLVTNVLIPNDIDVGFKSITNGSRNIENLFMMDLGFGKGSWIKDFGVTDREEGGSQRFEG